MGRKTDVCTVKSPWLSGWAPIASHYKKITLAPGETKTLVFVLGYVEMPVDQKFEADGKTINKVKALEMIEQFDTPEKFAQGMAVLKTKI